MVGGMVQGILGVKGSAFISHAVKFNPELPMACHRSAKFLWNCVVYALSCEVGPLYLLYTCLDVMQRVGVFGIFVI